MRNLATGAPATKSLGLAFIDVDQDGRMDMLVANDTVKKYFFCSLDNRTFEEVRKLCDLAYGSEGRRW